MDLPFRDIIDIILRYHNGHAWVVAQNEDHESRIKAKAAREIISKIKEAKQGILPAVGSIFEKKDLIK